MKIDIPYLLLTLALLLIPRQILRRGFTVGRRSKRGHDTTSPRLQRQPGDHGLRMREEFRKVRNYIDLLRAGVGSICVVSVCIVAQSPNPGAVALQAAILALAILIQTVRIEERVSLYAPVFFIAGINAGIDGVLPAALGFVAAWVLNPLLPNPATFLVAMALCTAGFHSAVFGLGDHLFVLPLATAALPILLSVILRRPLSGLKHHARA